eukprot:g12576.t1
MTTYKNIIAAIDTRLKAHPIVEEAARIAKSNGASLKIVDVVPELPWVARLVVREHANFLQMVGREKQQQLENLASRIRGRGVDVETKVLYGKTSVEIVREVLRGRHDVVLAVAKGKNSRRKEFFGTTARRLLRDCPSAVWLIPDADSPEYNHVMACFDTATDYEADADLNASIYDLASMVSQQHEARCSIVQAWRMNGESILKNRVSGKDFMEMLEQRHEYVDQLFNEFLAPLSRTTSDGDVHLLKGEPESVIPAFARENVVDLIVMGTLARRGLSGLVIGNTAERILNEVNCSVLVVKPNSVVAQIKEAEYIDIEGEVEHASFFPQQAEGLTGGTYWIMGAAGALGLFASILAHELGHAVVARRFDLHIRGITLFIFGGVAEMSKEPPSPKVEFFVAIAGPIVSILISAGCLAAGVVGGQVMPDAVSVVVWYLGIINGVVVAFNMIPAFPLDGGRVLRSILWQVKGNLRWATRISSSIGSGFGLMLIGFGLLNLLTGNVIGAIWQAMIGMFLRNAAQMSYQQVLVRRALEGEPVARFMEPDVTTVHPSLSVEELVENYVYRLHHKMFPVTDNGRLLGCVTTRDVQSIPRNEWPTTTVAHISSRCEPDNMISPDSDAMEALSQMSRDGTHRLMRGIDFKVGRCVVEMEAEFADVAIELIRELELPLAITFNRGRMMLLPASISKSSGLRQLLDTLGASVHNAIGIGDAENDHELLTCCEHGVAVSWGSTRLKESANDVIQGEGPEAVADYIDRISAELRLPIESSSHRKVVLEEIDGHAPFEMLIRGRNVLVAGDSKSGKSWFAGMLVEQQILQGYTVYAFDPEGDYSSLASLPNTVVLGGGRLLPHGDDLKMLLQQGISVVLNLSHLQHNEKCEYIQRHLPLVADYRRERGFPHRIMLDECHYFLSGPLGKRLLDFQLDGYTLVTFRPSQLRTDVLKSIDVVAVTRLAEHKEVDVLRDLLDDKSDHYVDSHDWYEQLASLGITEAALLPPTEETNGTLRRFIVAPRLTAHVRHRTKYYDIPVSEEHEFVFTIDGQRVGESAATLRHLAATVTRVSPNVLINHSRHHDFSRWIATLFCDTDLANDVRKLESALKNDGAADAFIGGLCETVEKRYEGS